MLRPVLQIYVVLALASACKDRDVPPNSSPSARHDSATAPGSDGSVATEDASPSAAPSGQPDASWPSTTDAGEVMTLCAKYGGADNVASVVQNQVFTAIAEDCRIHAFFTALTDEGQLRVKECLSLQVQELFGCEGIRYEGSHASSGLPCRSMAKAHIGLQISQGDFDALIEDVVAGMTTAGIEAQDIAQAAPALLGMHDDIVEQPQITPSMNACE